MTEPDNKQIVIGSDPPKITKVMRLEMDCPKDTCSHKFDVNNFGWGLKLKCPACGNITYNPEYDKDRHNRKKFWVGIIISFLLGLAVNYIYDVIINNFSK